MGGVLVAILGVGLSDQSKSTPNLSIFNLKFKDLIKNLLERIEEKPSFGIIENVIVLSNTQ